MRRFVLLAALAAAGLLLPGCGPERAGRPSRGAGVDDDAPRAPGGTRLAGSVAGRDGAPVRGAVVTVRMREAEEVRRSEPVLADAAGRFEIEAPRLPCLVAVEAEGFEPAFARVETGGGSIRLALERPGRLETRILDPWSRPLRGAWIELRPGGADWPARARIGADAEGAVRYSAGAAEAIVAGAPGFLPVVLFPGCLRAHLDRAFAAAGVVRDERGAPIGGATVRAKGIVSETDSEGRFRLDGLPFRDKGLELLVDAAGFVLERLLAVPGDEQIAVHLRTAAVLRCKVIRPDGSTEPLPCISVESCDLGGPVPADREGWATIGSIPPGRARVAAWIEVGESRLIGERAVEFVAGETTEVVLQPRGRPDSSVRFLFRDEEGQPVASLPLGAGETGPDGAIRLSPGVPPGRELRWGLFQQDLGRAFVELRCHEGANRAVAGGPTVEVTVPRWIRLALEGIEEEVGGRVEGLLLRDLEPDQADRRGDSIAFRPGRPPVLHLLANEPYRLCVFADGRLPWRRERFIAPESDGTLRVALRCGAVARLRVRLPESIAPEHLTVYSCQEGGGDSVGVPNSGEVVWEALDSGAAVLVVEDRLGCCVWSAAITVSGEAPIDLGEATIRAPGRISGRLVDRDGRPAGSVFVGADLEPGDPRRRGFRNPSTATHGDGAFELPLSPLGRALVFRKPGHGEVRIDLPPGPPADAGTIVFAPRPDPGGGR